MFTISYVACGTTTLHHATDLLLPVSDVTGGISRAGQEIGQIDEDRSGKKGEETKEERREEGEEK